VLHSHGIDNVRIEHVQGNLSDHYDPKANVIRLSNDVYGSTSAAAIGVACHEAGHAVQYAQNYGPIKLRAAIIPVTNIGSMLAMPLIMLGLVLNFLTEVSFVFVYIGIACFGLSLLLQLITLPVEFNASRRAISAISDAGLLNEEELDGAKKTLRAAALTYVAAAAVSLMQFLRLIMLFGGRRRDD
jgi:Zn-dependent membrane protease YugP